MKIRNRVFSLLLAALMVLAIAPLGVFATSVIEPFYADVVLNGNKGATINVSRRPEVKVDREDLVGVTVTDYAVIVDALDGAKGIAKVIMTSYEDVITVEIPVGYTTFMFDGDKLTVYEGSDTNYEVTGINKADEEYVVGDENFPLTFEEDEEGNRIYKNSDKYSLNVGIKKNGGDYVFAGNADDMSITVKKEATKPAHLMLAGLELASQFTAPITVKKDSQSTVEITALEGYTNTLEDTEFNDADTYGAVADGGDGTNEAYAESAVIKGKASAKITIDGAGALTVVGNAKNAIKTGELGSITIEDVNLTIFAQKNGISADNVVNINSGDVFVSANNDGIKASPDAVDAENGMQGNINITGGYVMVTSNEDGINAANDINLTGGFVTVMSGGVGSESGAFKADGKFVINGAYVFGAGSKINASNVDVSSQSYVTYTEEVPADYMIIIKVDGETQYSSVIDYPVDYVIYSEPELDVENTEIITEKYVKTYPVTFVDGLTGEIIAENVEVPEGEEPVPPMIPNHPGYVYVGIEILVDDSTGNVMAILTYEPIAAETYNVTFVDGLTGEVIAEDVEFKSDEEIVPPSIPEHEGYVYTGIELKFDENSGKYIATLIYKPVEETFKVTFVDGVTNQTIAEYDVKRGEAAPEPGIPEHDGYEFAGYDKEFDNIQEDTVVTLLYNEVVYVTYDVTFVDGLTGKVIAVVTVREGEAAQAPIAPVHDGYNFRGWDKAFDNVTENMTVTAIYIEIMPTDRMTGDANLDGVVDSSDATAILRHVAQLDELTGVAYDNADANHDGTVDSADATSVLRFVAKLQDLD